MKTTRLDVRHGDANLSLLEFLARHLQLSKSRAKDLLDERAVLVNRRRIWMARHKLRHGDQVEILRADPKSAQRACRPRVLFRDEQYLVLDKGPGILSNGPGSIEEVARESLQMPGLLSVHRLDRDTSGCLLMARDSETCEAAIRVFQHRLIHKTYHAIVSGHFETGGWTIRRPLDGLPAVTNVKTLDGNRDASHLMIKMETGRTHQIRKHLASIRHPVLGDRQYGNALLSDPRVLQVPRQMLHASKLEFPHPSGDGQKIVVESPLPSDFRYCLRMFGLT